MALEPCPPHPTAAGRDGDGARADRRCRRWTLGVVCAATALLLFNVTAPNVALPDLERDLGASFVEQQWVLSAYALVLASLLLPGGVLGDRYGRRRLFLYGLVGFALASAAAAAAPDPTTIILARGLQGLAAAVLFPASLALVAATFQGPERARAIGVWGASVSGAIALGPFIGGVLVELSGWRAVFVLSVVGAPAVWLAGFRHLQESRDPDAGRLDLPGTVLLTSGLMLAVFALLRGNTLGWGSATVVGALAGGAALVAGFVAAEHRVATPLIAPELMRNRTFVGTSLVALVFAGGGFGPLVFLTLFLLAVVGSSPIEAGLQIAPFAAASFGVSLLAARVAAAAGVRATLIGGLALSAGGLLLLLGLETSDGWARLVPGLVVFGAGAGLVNPTMTVAALSVVGPEHSGMASGVNNTARQLGIAAGIAGLGAVLEATAGPNPSPVAFTEGLNDVLLVAVAITLAGILVVATIIRAPQHPEPAPAPAR